MPQRPVSSIVGKQKVLTAPLATTVADAACLMKDHHVSAMLVVDGDGRLTGIFTERDALFRVIAERRSPKTTRIGDVMTAHPQTIDADRPFVQALVMMHEGGFRHVPVVRDGRPLGMVSARDALGLELKELDATLEQRRQIGESLG
jgi:CBS domain-containing protein